jgi:hypothetical protein
MECGCKLRLPSLPPSSFPVFHLLNKELKRETGDRKQGTFLKQDLYEDITAFRSEAEAAGSEPSK